MTESGIAGYRAYLAERNGEADLLNRRLELREAFFAQMEAEPIHSEWVIDTGDFEHYLARRRPPVRPPPEMAFLLATAKLNQAERFGVGLGETYGLNSGPDLPPERVYLELEEHYHTNFWPTSSTCLGCVSSPASSVHNAAVRQDGDVHA